MVYLGKDYITASVSIFTCLDVNITSIINIATVISLKTTNNRGLIRGQEDKSDN